MLRIERRNLRRLPLQSRHQKLAQPKVRKLVQRLNDISGYFAEKPAEKIPEMPAGKVAAATNPPQQAKPASAAEPAPSGKWWVQIGVFASRDNAQSLAQKLRAAGFIIDVSQMRSNGKELFRVRGGPVADKPAAVALQSRLDAAGQKKSSLVAP